MAGYEQTIQEFVQEAVRSLDHASRDFSQLAESFGIEYVNLSDHPEQLEHCLASTPKTSRILELKTGPSKGSKQRRLVRRTKSVVRQNFGEKIFGLVKRAFARGGYPPR